MAYFKHVARLGERNVASRPHVRAIALGRFVLPCVLVLGCTGTIGEPEPGASGLRDPGGPASPASSPPTAGSSASGGRPAAGSGSSKPGANGSPAAGGAGSPAPVSEGDSVLLPARIRRLTTAEFDASVKALLGIDSKFGASFTPDARQGGFTRNDAQRVDPVFSTQLNDAAQRLAAMAKSDLSRLAPCNENAADGSLQCARDFIGKFAARAYRRPLSSRESDALQLVYEAGSDGASYADGVEAVISALLQSPGFLYVTELGSQPMAAKTTLTDYEIASALGYLLTGAAPDDALLQAAQRGELRDADKRRAQASRLLMTSSAAAQIVRMVQEWLGIDRISETAKDSNVYPDFAGLRDAMKQEADSFVNEVMWKSGGSVRDLLSADWTIAPDPLARMYLNLGGGQSVPRSGDRVSLGSVRRRGILNQAAFLSVYAHATETAPVLRGVAVLRRVACLDIPSPTSLNINVVPPVPDPTKTTRERFAIHSQDPVCASCHTRIDALGFSFEALDAMGRARDGENGQPVDSRTTLSAGFGFDGDYTDSADLAQKLAASSELQACFARQLFRYAVARSDSVSQDAEAAFVNSVEALPASAQGHYSDLLLAFIASDAFIERGASL